MPKTTAKAPKPSSSVPEASPRPVIEVRDFGPIANGVIEQRPLTVFAGPSNTGKSWMATLLYVLERHRQRLVVPGFPVGSKSSVLQTIENPSAWRTSIKNGEVLHLTPQETKAWCRIAKHVAEDVLPEQMQRSYGVGELASLTRECHGSKMSISFAVGSFAFRLDGMSRSTKAGPQRSKHAPFHVALPDNTEIPVSGRSRGSLLAILDVLMQAAKKV